MGLVTSPLASLVASVLRATLLRPYVLGARVDEAWGLCRDAALGALGCILAYAAVRAMLAASLDLGDERPWALPLRAALAAAGAQLSLSAVQGVLAANNALVAALGGVAGGGMERLLVAPIVLGLGATAGLVPAVIAILAAAAALWIAVTYYVRAAEIVFLALLAPFAAILWLLPAGSGVWRAWLGELLPAVFLQAGQALVLWGFLAVSSPGGGAALVDQLLTALAALVLLGRVRGVLRSLAHAPEVGGQSVPAWVAGRLVPSLGGLRRSAGW